MKVYLYVGMVFIFTLFTVIRAFSADDMESLIRDQMNSVVETEYRATQTQLQSGLNQARSKVKMLEGQKSEALQRAAEKAATTATGQTQFKQFYTLIKNRYINKKAVFEPAMEVSSKDIENINDLFKSYLSMTVFFGRVSAGQAVKKLEYGMEKLDELAQIYGSPTESNNSELEIIGKQIRDEEAKIERTQQLASALSLKLDTETPVAAAPRVVIHEAVTAPAPKRSPASIKKLKPMLKSKFKKKSKRDETNKDEE